MTVRNEGRETRRARRAEVRERGSRGPSANEGGAGTARGGGRRLEERGAARRGPRRPTKQQHRAPLRVLRAHAPHHALPGAGRSPISPPSATASRPSAVSVTLVACAPFARGGNYTVLRTSVRQSPPEAPPAAARPALRSRPLAPAMHTHTHHPDRIEHARVHPRH